MLVKCRPMLMDACPHHLHLRAWLDPGWTSMRRHRTTAGGCISASNYSVTETIREKASKRPNSEFQELGEGNHSWSTLAIDRLRRLHKAR